jgi:hypothetical protein
MTHATVLLLLLVRPAPGAQDPATKDVRSLEDKIVAEAAASMKAASPADAAAVARHLSPWFPGRAELEAAASQTGPPSKQGQELLKKLAGMGVDFAAASARSGRPATASMEAFRALGIDPRCAKAAAILRYVNGRHPREEALSRQGLVRTEWGWLPQRVARESREGAAPDGDRWVDEKLSDSKHADWNSARSLSYPLVTLKTNIPIRAAAMIGARADWFLQWLRSRFCLTKSYQEPKWPLSLEVIDTSAQFSKRFPAAASPFGFSDLITAFVCHEACRNSSEKTEGIAQHELGHVFLAACFDGGKPQQDSDAWMIEAFPAYCYYVSPEHPIDGDFWARMQNKFSKADTRRPHFDRVLDGQDVLGELMTTPLARQSKDQLAQHYMAGSLFAHFAIENGLCDQYFEFAASVYSRRARPDAFERTFGPSSAVSKRMGEWLKRRERK